MTEAVDGVLATGSTPLSSELLTFLIADVRGYTRYTNEYGDEAAARLADRFAALSEEILGQYGGRVIELRGDEALAVFASARDALRGAVALQGAFKQSLAHDPSLPLNVGMGLDAGEAIPVRGGYRGGALNLAARLCSIAGAGEILSSETVIGLARRTEGLAFVDRGQVTLKGLLHPIRVLQIAPEGALPDSLPPLQPILVTHPTNLPDDPTPFIGREHDVRAISSLLQAPHVRLVTLTGPGGTGKTRLALQIGSTLLHAFPDGVFFCDLSSIARVDLVPSAIAEVLNVKQLADKSLTESLAEGLAGTHLLLVLDNFEHLLGACSLVASVLDACRELHILVTSRIPLHLSREREYPVPPLAVPDPAQLPDLETLSQYESVALFLQRAEAVKPGFRVTNENAPAIAEICARLDGLPLAIELAAARVKLFPPGALLQRLGKRLQVLTGGAKDRPARHQTLRGAIEWSYSLLEEPEKTFFARLSVFAGGWTFEAAEAVCNGEGDLDLFQELASLIDKSLVRQEGEDEPRFRMLETIREYAAEKLEEQGEAEALQEAHAAYFAGLAGEAFTALRGPSQFQWIQRLDLEVPNLWAAVRRLLDTDRIPEAVEILSLYDYFIFRIHSHEAVRWLEIIINRADERVPPGVRGKAFWSYAAITSWMWWGHAAQQRDLIPYLERALPLLEEAGETYWCLRTLNALGNMHKAIGMPEKSMAFYQQALEMARTAGNQRSIAILYQNLALLSSEQGDDEAAARCFEEGTAMFRALGEANMLANQLFEVGAFHVLHGRLDVARTYLNECLPTFEASARPNWIGLTFHALGVLALKEGDLEEASDRLRRALLLFVEHKADADSVEILGSVAMLALAQGYPERAAVLLSAKTHLRQSLDVFPATPLDREHPRVLARVRALLDTDTWERAEIKGVAMSLEEAVAYALS